ncbi:hypothetical protein LINGRAHAP2_LOCUS35026, partial [Linum grandiflorum]
LFYLDRVGVDGGYVFQNIPTAQNWTQSLCTSRLKLITKSYGSLGAGVVLPLNQGDVVHLPVVEATQNPTDYSRKESLKEPMQERQRVDFALPEVFDVGGQYAGVLHVPIHVEAMELEEVQKTLDLLNVQITSLQNVT